MIGASSKNKMVNIALPLGFIVGVVAISISFSYNAIASVRTPSSVGVQVGGGDPTNPLFGYIPQNVEIKAGSSVVWYVRPFVPAEPHTVTFVFDNKTMVNGFLPSYQRVFDPAIIDSNNVTKIYSPNANLTITGTEKYVNSGWMFPGRKLPGSSSTFSVTFQKAGTYNYQCLMHPWMVGKVVVT
jgi:plastocyanin